VLVEATESIWDGIRRDHTFVVFNYEKVSWNGFNNQSEEYQSLAGMMHGDYQGNTPLPFSQLRYDLNSIALRSTVIGKPGRYIYDVTEKPQRIGCLDLLDETFTSYEVREPLTTSTTDANIFGGTIVKVQGQCRNNSLKAQCGFAQIDETVGPMYVPVDATYLNEYTAVCITPRLDLGRSEISLSLDKFEIGFQFFNSFFVDVPTVDDVLVHITSGKNYLEALTTDEIVVKWDDAVFKAVPDKELNVYIYAYRLVGNSIVSALHTAHFTQLLAYWLMLYH
jgi:hypothetical protein